MTFEILRLFISFQIRKGVAELLVSPTSEIEADVKVTVTKYDFNRNSKTYTLKVTFAAWTSFLEPM